MIKSNLTHWRYHFVYLGREDILDRITLLEERDFLDRDRWRDYSDQLRQVKNPVLWACCNPVDIDEIQSRAQEIWAPGNFFIMNWDWVAQPTANQSYWPCFFIEQRLTNRRAISNRQHRISFLAGRIRPHRLALWQQIRNLIRDNDVIVVNAFGKEYCNFSQSTLELLPWSNAPQYLDEEQSRGICTNTTAIDHPAFRACVNITMETLGEGSGVFATEKTWKAIAAGCMPWHFSSQGIARCLQDLGFQDWFANSEFDCAAATDLFARNDIWDFYHNNQFLLEKDLELFWGKDLLEKLTQAPIQRLESWLAR